MIIISAMSTDRVIGSGNGMPWNVRREYQQYLDFVRGNTVIMGRRSFEIFGPDLPLSTNAIVITRRERVGGADVADSLETAVRRANQIGKTVFVAGGASIYELAIPVADAMYLSTIKGSFQGDTYFPQFDENDWKLTEERDETEFLFRRYKRLLKTD